MHEQFDENDDDGGQECSSSDGEEREWPVAQGEGIERVVSHVQYKHQQRDVGDVFPEAQGSERGGEVFGRVVGGEHAEQQWLHHGSQGAGGCGHPGRVAEHVVEQSCAESPQQDAVARRVAVKARYHVAQHQRRDVAQQVYVVEH